MDKISHQLRPARGYPEDAGSVTYRHPGYPAYGDGLRHTPRNKMSRQRILAKEQVLGHCLETTEVELPTK
jgi:hypothetical protein